MMVLSGSRFYSGAELGLPAERNPIVSADSANLSRAARPSAPTAQPSPVGAKERA